MAEFRVLHTIPRLFGQQGGIMGGAERYALELARHMANEVPTSLVCFGDEGDRHETMGQLEIHVIGHPWEVRKQTHNPMALRLWRDLQQASVVHCHQQHILASSFAAAACRLSGRKVFVSGHGGGGWDISGYVSTDRWYHGHLHVSEYSRFISGQAGRPWAHVILGGVDTQKFSPDASVQRKPRVVYVGRLMPHKGINDLINALPPGLELELIGQPYDHRFVDDLKKMAEGKAVVFRHDCSDEDLLEAYRSALCVVLPSVYRSMYGDETKIPELLGQTLLEGMACGTAAICSNVAGMPEVVVDGVTGFTVPPNDPNALREKLTWLLEHPGQADAMGAAGRARVLRLFTWQAVVSRCLQIYRATGNGSRNGSMHQKHAGG
jgi:glycosyltransferase involved in cell wall biosynthesis